MLKALVRENDPDVLKGRRGFCSRGDACPWLWPVALLWAGTSLRSCQKGLHERLFVTSGWIRVSISGPFVSEMSRCVQDKCRKSGAV